MPVTAVEFISPSGVCRAWHGVADTDVLAGPQGRPVVVMAHGVGGTVDSGLLPFAKPLCAIGCDVLAFDYHGFGASAGVGGQSVSMRRQVEDYHAAVDIARSLPTADPDRVVLWGASLAGGHVVVVAAQRSDVAAVIAVTPLVDGWAAAVLALRQRRPGSLARCTLAGIRSRIRTARGGRPITIPLVGLPGEDAALNLEGYHGRYTALAGPTWVNRIDAAVGFELLRYRPTRVAAKVRCPMLVQIGDADRSAPPAAQAGMAAKAGALVQHYPCDHFDVWPHGPAFDAVIAHQREFLYTLFRDSPR